MNQLPAGTFAVGNRLYAQCPTCGKVVRFKAVFGTLHLCLTDEEVTAQNSRRRFFEQPTRISQDA